MHQFSTAAAKASGVLHRLCSLPRVARTSGRWEAPEVPPTFCTPIHALIKIKRVLGTVSGGSTPNSLQTFVRKRRKGGKE